MYVAICLVKKLELYVYNVFRDNRGILIRKQAVQNYVTTVHVIRPRDVIGQVTIRRSIDDNTISYRPTSSIEIIPVCRLVFEDIIFTEDIICVLRRKH